MAIARLLPENGERLPICVLSDKDENERKTMNTHLHILEPYTNLYRVWKDERLKRQLRNLIELFTDKILNPKTGHLELFFDDNWRVSIALFLTDMI